PIAARARRADDVLRVPGHRPQAGDGRGAAGRAPTPRDPARARARGRDRGARPTAPVLRRDPVQAKPQLGGRGGARRSVPRLPRGAVPQRPARRRSHRGRPGGVALGVPPVRLAPARRRRRAVRRGWAAAVRHGASIPRIDARRRGVVRRESVRAGAVGGAVSVRVSGEGLGVLLGPARHPRADGAHEHGVEQHQPVDRARRHDPAGVRLFQPPPSWGVVGFPLRRTPATRNPAHPAAVRTRDDGAREHGARLARRDGLVRAVAGAVPAAGPARGRGDRVRRMDGDSRVRVRGGTEGPARAEIFLGGHPPETRSAGTAVTRPGRPVRPERRGLLKPESNDWSLTMASAFPPRGHDIGHSIWVHDRACWLNNSSPRSLYYNTAWIEYVKRRRHAEPSRKIVGAPTDESHAPGRDRLIPAVGHPRVRAAPRQRAGAGAVRSGRSLVRPPHHRGRAEVPVVTAAPPALPGRRRSRPIGPIYFEPNVTPTRSGRNFVDTSEVWMLA